MATYHPTFLYEALWDLALAGGVLVNIWVSALVLGAALVVLVVRCNRADEEAEEGQPVAAGPSTP